MENLSAFQKEFDDQYITSTEISEELGVRRATILNARLRGMLPEPIKIKGIRLYIWNRAATQPYIDAWRITLASRRGELK